MSPGFIGMAGVYQIIPEQPPASIQPGHAGVKWVVPMFQRTDDLRITQVRPLIPPAILLEEIPITERASNVVANDATGDRRTSSPARTRAWS